MEPAILAPALSASSASSWSESRPAPEGSPARPRGDFFRATPTSSTRSRGSTDSGVLIGSGEILAKALKALASFLFRLYAERQDCQWRRCYSGTVGGGQKKRAGL